MNILILFPLVFGIALAQPGDIRDCDQGHGAASGRDSYDIYQRPPGYDSVSYTPHTSYGPPDPMRPASQRNYPQDSSEGENSPRYSHAQGSAYNEIRPVPIYGPPPSRSRVAAAAGIYDDYDDILYNQPTSAPPPPPLVRRYTVNYAHREPYYPRYDAYAAVRRPEYRVPVYYSPLIPDGFIPIHSHSPATPGKIEQHPTTTEGQRPHSTPASYQREHQQTSSTDQEIYDEDQIRRQQPIGAAVNNSLLQNEIKRHLFRKPFIGLRNLFRGSILAKKNKIGLVPPFVQASASNL